MLSMSLCRSCYNPITLSRCTCACMRFMSLVYTSKDENPSSANLQTAVSALLGLDRLPGLNCVPMHKCLCCKLQTAVSALLGLLGAV